MPRPVLSKAPGSPARSSAALRRGRGPLVLLLATAAACSNGGRAPPAGSEGGARTWAYEREFPGGGNPVSLVIRLDKVDLTLADRIVMEQELRVASGFESSFPEYLPEDFENFSVVEINRAAPDERKPGTPGDPGAAPAAARIEMKRIHLEPDRSGDLAIAPLAVYFHAAGEAKESSFLTEEIPVKVQAIAELGALEARPPRDIFLAAPRPAGYAGVLAAAGGAGLLLATAAGVWWFRRRRRPAPPPVPPHEVAYEALRRLAALGLVEKGEIELFFVHLSRILRQYIEDRFRVRAPERTTEEFLEEAARDASLAHHRARLAQFLKLSDQVKFARYQPDAASIQGAFDVLKQFLQETTPREP